MAALLFLTDLTIALLLGLFCLTVSKLLRINSPLLLMLTGLGLSNMEYLGAPLIGFPDTFTIVIGFFALIMTAFDASAKLKFRDFDSFSRQTSKFAWTSLIITVAIMTFFTYKIARIDFFLSLLFSLIISLNTVDMSFLKGHKVREFLRVESFVNTALIIFSVFVLMDITNVLSTPSSDKINILFQQIGIGLGIGIIVGLIVFNLISKHSNNVSILAILTAALIAYVFAEQLDGNGILAVLTLGIFFSNINIHKKQDLMYYPEFLSKFLMIFVLILVGFIIKLPITNDVLVLSMSLYFYYIIVRFSLLFAFGHFNLNEKLYITFNSSKGMAAAILILILSTLNMQGLEFMLSIAFMIMLYSAFVSAIATRFSHYFIGEK